MIKEPTQTPMPNGIPEGTGGSETGWKTGEEEAVVADKGVGPVGTAEGVVLSPGDGEGDDMRLGRMVSGGAKRLIVLRISYA